MSLFSFSSSAAGKGSSSEMPVVLQAETHRLLTGLLNSNLTTESKLSLRELYHQGVCSIAMSVAALDITQKDE